MWRGKAADGNMVEASLVFAISTASSLRPQQQYRNADAVLHSVCSGAQKHVGQKAMAVGAHGHQVAALLLDPFDDLVGGLAIGQLRVRMDPFRLKFVAYFLQVGVVFDNFAADRVASIGPGGPAVSDVQ